MQRKRTDIKIRPADKTDLPQIYNLIGDLAVFEHEPGEPTVSLDEFTTDFGRLFNAFVAESSDGKLAGMALYYWGYSSWKGKMLYLDDLIVRDELRQQGVGKALFNAVVALAASEGAGQLRWQVLDWNQPAIDMYRRAKADFYDNWLTCKLEAQAIREYHPL